MSNPTSEHARSLFDAAKQDGPSEAARDVMWASIQTTTAGASSLAMMKGASVASSKLVLGIALGATLTVGIAATVLALSRTTAPPRSFERVTAIAPRTLERPVLKADEEAPPPVLITGHVAPVQAQPQQATTAAMELDQAAPTRTATTTLSEHDRLAREARMVSEARGALHRGEPEAALRIVRAARNQKGARMVPEELTVEAQALRAMGDEAEAQRVDAELAGKFPEQSIGH